MSNFSSTYPSVSPTYQIDFANGKRIPPNATFSRSDSPIDATKAAASAVHYWSNEKHLSDENYATYSEQFDQWTQVGMSYTANATAAPDGNTTADLLYATASSNFAWLGNILTYGPTRQKCCSFYVKANSWTWIQIGPNGGGRVWFDIATGTKGTENSGYTGTISAVGSTGWYRVSVESNDTTSLAPIIKLVDADGSSTATPSGTNGVYVWGCKAELGVTTPTAYVTATGSQLLREYAPTLKSVSTAGQPRFEYDPTDGQSEGILIESASTNLLAYSDDFANQWTITGNVNVTESAGISPTGELNADLVYADGTAADSHYLYSSCTVTAAAHTFSVYAKFAGVQYIQLEHRVTGSGNAQFDLVNGTFVATNATGAMEPVGNGWYRCSVTETQSAGTAFGRIWLMGGSGVSDYNWDGDSYSGVLLFGAQYEANSSPSSLITSNGSATTRALDSMSMTDSSLFDNGEGTIVAEYDTSNPSAVAGIAAITDGTGSSNAVSLRLQASTAKLFVNNAGATQAATSTTAPSAGVFQKIAGRYAVNDFGVSVNGGSVVSDASGSVPVVSKLEIGTMDNGSYHLNGHVKRVAIYPALSDTNLQAITS